MRNSKTIKTLVILFTMGLSSIALGQWDFNWFVDTQSGSTNLVSAMVPPDVDGNMDSGNLVYLMSAGADGIINGIDANGNILGDDSVVVLEGGAYAMGTIGLVDYPPVNPQNDGEFNQTSTMQDSYAGQYLYALAFQQAVSYGAGQFFSNGYYSVSTLSQAVSGLDGETWDAGSAAWTTGGTLVPEPTTVALMLAGLGGVVAYRKKRSGMA